MLSASFALRMSAKLSMPCLAKAPPSTMSLNRACVSADILRRSGVMFGPSVWQREHCSMNLVSPAAISRALALFSGGFGKGSSRRTSGFRVSPPSSLKAMMRFAF